MRWRCVCTRGPAPSSCASYMALGGQLGESAESGRCCRRVGTLLAGWRMTAIDPKQRTPGQAAFMRQVPNGITIFRFLLVIPAGWLLWQDAVVEALVVIAVAGLSMPWTARWRVASIGARSLARWRTRLRTNYS